jgi:cardiolipin synthase
MSAPTTFGWDEPVGAPFFDVDVDRVRLLVDGAMAFRAMLAAIRKAEREILLEMYWVGDDLVGRRFRAELAAAARRGVMVRVVVDAIGSLGLPGDFWAPVEREGGIVYVFHALSPFARRFRLDLLDRRDHRKLLLVDGSTGFLGGINLALPWLPRECGGEGFRDDAIELSGPSLADLRALFFKTWSHVSGTRTGPAVGAFGERRMGRVWALASPTSRRARRGVLREYLFRIHRARRSIDFANAYFVPRSSFRHALYGARRRGVRVRLLLPEVSDIRTVQLAQEAFYDDYLAAGIEVYLLRNAVLHSKTAIVDRAFVTSGSYNLDERSRVKNFELNLAVECPAFAAHVTEVFERDLEGAVRLTRGSWQNRGVVRRGAQAFAHLLRRLL